MSRMQKYPSGSRGSPAKGVVLENGSAGSNPAFCAKTSRGIFPRLVLIYGNRRDLRVEPFCASKTLCLELLAYR